MTPAVTAPAPSPTVEARTLAGASARPASPVVQAIEARLADAGHPALRRNGAGVVAALGNRGLHHAELLPKDDAWEIEVVLASGKPLSDASREALGRFLARGAEGFCSLAASLRSEGDRQVAVLTRVLPLDADATAIAEAIAGLALACDHLGQAARALAAEPIARRYLTHLNPNEGAA